MATLYKNPTLDARPDAPGGAPSGYDGYIEPDTRVPPKAQPIFSAVSVNGVTIPEAEILAEAQNHPADNPGGAVAAATRALVVRQLLLQEARRSGISSSVAPDGDGRVETADDALIRALIDEVIDVPRAGEDECRRVYEQRPDRFRTAPLYEARHILIAAHPDDKAARAAARETAAAIAMRLADDPSAFATLAASHSACQSQGEGGRLGQISRGDTVAEFEAALERLAEGEITSSPVETRFGFHVIALDRRIDGELRPFEDVRERIAGWLEAASWSRAVSQYISLLAGEADIEGVDVATGDGPLVQ